jgi:DNA-binding GntR family transcriptional regulator
MRQSLGKSTRSLPQLTPVETATLQDRIYAQLREALMEGLFEPGEALPIHRLTSAFGTSPMPAREAVRRLIAEGALESPPNKTTRVPTLSEDRFAHLSEARLLLEGWAAEHAAQNVTPKELRKLTQLNEELERAVERGVSGDVLRSNRDFHFAVYRLSGNPLILSAIENLWVRSGPYIRFLHEASYYVDVSQTWGSLSHHAELLDALGRADAQAAGRAMREDVRTSIDAYQRLLESASKVSNLTGAHTRSGSKT